MTDQPAIVLDAHRCTCESIGLSLTGDDAAEYIEAMNAYLAGFAAPVQAANTAGAPHVCLQCGEYTDGLLGRFRWGHASGEGKCGECGWPARAHHYPKLADGELIFDRCLEFVLQYHPDDVQISKRDESDD